MNIEDFWAGSFGDSYLQRNQIDPATRLDFWRSAIEYCTPATVLEVGCNRGHNLVAIQMVDQSIECYGVDVNESAVNEARSQGLDVQHGSAVDILGFHEPSSMDLVFTAGVLIHISPEDLEDVMRAIATTSSRYVLAVEYASESEEEEPVEYRGHSDKLWKRNYGALYQNMGLRLISVTPNAEGFDACTAWLLEKVQS